MELSKRLYAVAGEIAGACLADIGTDHGYIPIYAVQTGRVQRAVATDIGKGPLERARRNIEKYGLGSCIETRLGAGLTPLRPGEADAAAITGMGGGLIADILRQGEPVLRKLCRLILQPQLDIPLVRRCVHGLDFSIVNEIMVRDEGKYYTILHCQPGRKDEEPYTEREYRLGKCLLERKDEVFLSYAADRQKKLLSIKESILQEGTAANTRISERLAEIEEELEMLRL